MNNSNDNMDSQLERIELRKWMQEHPNEYGDMTREMGEADLLDVFLMGQAAFMASPEFQKRLEDMIDLDEGNVDELVRILQESGFTEAIFINPDNDEEWEKYRLPFAAWLKHGRSAGTVIENIEDAISLTDNQQAKWQLSRFLKDAMRRMVKSKKRSVKDLKEYLDYRNAVASDNVTEWALNGVNEDTSPSKSITKEEPQPNSLKDLIASQDADMISRIREWVVYRSKGIDIAHLFVALIESGEIEPKLRLTRFMEALKISFPQSKIVGVRQVQKDVNMLQSLMPHGKRYGKDEPLHRVAIDMIKANVLKKNPENID